MGLHKLAIRVAGVRVAELNFHDLEKQIMDQQEKVDNISFQDSSSEEELDEALEEIFNLAENEKPEAFLLFEDFLEMLDEFEWADKKLKGLVG